jgi:hypothetical protein
MACAYGPHMLAHDRRLLDISLGKYNHEAPVSSLGLRQYFQLFIKASTMLGLNSKAVIKTAAEPTTTTTPTATTATTTSTALHRTLPPYLLAIRQGLQHSPLHRQCFAVLLYIVSL